MTPETLLLLANLTVPRRPDRGPLVHPDPLATPLTAAQALRIRAVDPDQLAHLRELHQTVVQLVDRLLSGRSVARQAAHLTTLASPSTAAIRLREQRCRGVRSQLDWHDPTRVSMLARQVIVELGEIELGRLRRCEREECDLVFYDTTRSGTRRWHAEAPCGLRERQRRYRRTHSRETRSGPARDAPTGPSRRGP